MFILIACIGKNREIGQNGQLIFRVKEDMQFFRETTSGHPILMGRKTWESLPGKLPERENIVVSRHPVAGADRTISDLPAFISENINSDQEIFVIGGGVLYKTLLPYAKTLYLTEVEAAEPSADTFFPDFEPQKYTKTLIKKGIEHDLAFSIYRYDIKTKE